MKKFILPIVLVSSVFLMKLQAQVGINTSTPTSTLDVTAKNATGSSSNVDGLLVPRVDRQRSQSMTSIPTSTLIYVNSIATGTQTGIAANIDTVGYYSFDGTVWVKINPKDWNLNGNAGTTPAGGNSTGTDFLGTTDDTDFQIRVGAIGKDVIRAKGTNGHVQLGNWVDVSSSPNLPNPDRFLVGAAHVNYPSSTLIANNFSASDISGTGTANFRSAAYVNTSAAIPFFSNYFHTQFNNGYSGSISGSIGQIRLDGPAGTTYTVPGSNFIAGNQFVVTTGGSSTITTAAGTVANIGSLAPSTGSTINGPAYGTLGRTSTAGTYNGAVAGVRGSIEAATATYNSTVSAVQGSITQGTLNGNAIGVDSNITGGTIAGSAIGLRSNVTATSANGYGLYIEDVAGTTQRGIYQVGTSDANNLAGNTRIGSTVAPVATLDVTGTARVSSRTGTATSVLGTDINGQLTDVTLGSGLSMTSGTLAATAVPISNIVFPFLNIQPSGSGVYNLDATNAPNYTLWVSSALPSSQCSVNLPDPNTMVGRTITIIAAGGDTRVCVPTGQGLPAGNGDNAAFKIIPDYKRATFQASNNFGGMWPVIAKDF